MLITIVSEFLAILLAQLCLDFVIKKQMLRLLATLNARLKHAHGKVKRVVSRKARS